MNFINITQSAKLTKVFKIPHISFFSLGKDIILMRYETFIEKALSFLR